jgi:hypothetical protein
MIKNEQEYTDWIISQGVGKKDIVASSIKSYISYLNSVSRIINEDISKENLFNENCISIIINKINKLGINIKSIPKYRTAMRQYVKMVNGSNKYTEKKLNIINQKTYSNQIHKPKKKSKYKGVFKMPNAVTIMGRSSSITNSFINGIIPIIEPADEEIEEVLRILKMPSNDIRCSYCGDKSSEWDHLEPIIKNKKPTGFISEIQNLVPACGKCNQSKGNQNWYDWIIGNAKQSPSTREVENLEEKINCLHEFENWKKTTNIDFKEIVGIEKWAEYESTYEKIISAMQVSQIISNEIKSIVKYKTR